MSILSFEKYSPQEIKLNLLSGLTVALAMVPEAIAFALIAHVSPLTGLYAAVLVSLITATFGGRPGMISGAAGALAVVMVALVVQHGVEYLFATVVLMGLLQILFAVAKLGKFIRMVPHPVMLGFVNGLAIVIFLAQFGHFKTVAEDGTTAWMSGLPLYTMLGLIALTMAVIYLLPKLTKAIPSTLAGIMVVSLGVTFLNIDTKTVGDLGSIAGGLPNFHIPQVPFNLETFKIIFPYALILAAVGLIETLKEIKNKLNAEDNLLGEMPDDLASYLAWLSIGSPAVCAYRALNSAKADQANQHLQDASTIAFSFVSLFNSVSGTGVIKRFSTN